MKNIDLSDKRAIAAAQNIKERDYWRVKMAGEPVKYHFYYDHKKTDGMPRKMDAMQFHWADDLFTRLMRLSNEYDYTLYMILAAGLTLLLDKYNYGGAGDIILGAPIYKQETAGDFINTVLPLRNRLEPGMTVKELLLRVKDTVVEANKHQNYPMEALLDYLGMSSSEDDFPLFDVAVLLENIHQKEYIGNLPLDMIFSMRRTAESIEGVVEYNVSLYRRSSVEKIVAHYIRLLEVVLAGIDTRLSAVDILTEPEKKQLLFDFNQAEPGYPKDKTIPQLFEAQVEKTPDHVGLVGDVRHVRPVGPVRLTYRQLNERSGGLAGLLIEKGVLADDIVGIMMERSIDLIIGILGILKAGGAYLPINPGNPRERVDYMLRDSGTKILVNEKFFRGSRAPRRGEPRAQKSPPCITNLAYIIYTSGSTGMPKGVPITHANLSPLLHWGYKHLGIGSKDRV
ncbi:MAG: hypothetical protein QG657_3121, partial [Acidobacteriota bacterium]|nr:hypothetical protein [Acidobacteriota bacterium]